MSPMAAPGQKPAAGRAGLLEKLLAAVRREFRAGSPGAGSGRSGPGQAGLPGRRLRPAPRAERALHHSREAVARPRAPGPGGVPAPTRARR